MKHRRHAIPAVVRLKDEVLGRWLRCLHPKLVDSRFVFLLEIVKIFVLDSLPGVFATFAPSVANGATHTDHDDLL